MTGNDAVLAAIDALEKSAIPFVVVGSYASNIYGVERSTADADFVIEPGEASLGRLRRDLLPAIRLDPQMTFETVTMTRRYVAEVPGTPFHIEFFLLGDDPHDRERFRRRREVAILGREVSVLTAEDVIVTKLRWHLLARRGKDRDDVRDVIAVQDGLGALDWPYIHGWCARHGTRALLDEIRASIPPIDG